MGRRTVRVELATDAGTAGTSARTSLGKRSKELPKEQDDLQTVFDAVNVGMMLIDPSGTVKRINNAVARRTGKDPSALRDDPPGNLVGYAYALGDAAGCGRRARCASSPIRNTFESVFRSGQSVHGVPAEDAIVVNGKEIRSCSTLTCLGRTAGRSSKRSRTTRPCGRFLCSS
jgi:PAS domain-containing protein